MKLKVIIFIILIFAIISTLVVVKFVNSKNSNSKKEIPTKKGFDTAISVKVIIVKPKKVDNKLLTTGTTIANESIEIRSEVSGKVTQILFVEGSRVRKGQLLVKINDSELKAQLEKTELRKTLAEEQEIRKRKLLEINGISKEEYDKALNELNTIKAEISLLLAQISKTEIYAPFDGIVGLRQISEGSYVSPSTLIATLQNINPIKVDFSIPEKYASIVKKGNKIQFTVGGSEEVYSGTVYAIEPRIDQLTRTLKLRAICPNDNEKILPGAFAKIELLLESIDNALMLPSEAIVPDIKGQRVFVYKSGKSVPVPVITGIRTDKEIQITRGLQAGDTVITSGLLQIRPNANVKIIY